MKNKILFCGFLIVTIVACSDFFTDKHSSDGGGKGAGNKFLPLPEKATLDPQACEYGNLQSGDSRQQLLWTTSTKDICPRVREFRYEVTRMRLAAEEFCADTSFKAAERDLEASFRHMALAYQYLLANPFGPLHTEKGKLAMEIYSWPGYNKFSINAEMLKAHAQGEAYAPQLSSTRKGISAVETLIFNKQSKVTPGLTGVLKPEEQAFNNLPQTQREAARCRVLRTMINDLALKTEELYAAWSSKAGAFPRTMLAEMNGGNAHMQLNEYSDGLYFAEKIKDFKLGMPLGLNARCRAKAKCPEDVEHFASGISIEAIRVNYLAFNDAFFGSDANSGFAKLLREVGREDLVGRFQALLTDIEKELSEMEKSSSLREQIEAMDPAQCKAASSPYPACRLFFKTKDLMDLYKTEFMTALNLQPPKNETDND